MHRSIMGDTVVLIMVLVMLAIIRLLAVTTLMVLPCAN